MTALTLQNLRDGVRDYLDIDTTDLPDSVLDVFLREGYSKIVQMNSRWPFLQFDTTLATVNGTKDYSLTALNSSTADSVTQIQGTNWILFQIGRDEGDRFWTPSVTATGQPTYWAEWASVIRLYPTPDAVYTLNVRGYKKADTSWFDTANGAGVCPLPEDFHFLLILHGVSRGYSQQDDYFTSEQTKQLFEENLAILEKQFAHRNGQQPLVMNGGTRNHWFLPDRLRFPFEF